MHRDGPASARATTAGVSVYALAGWSAKDAADEFRYTTGPPPTVKPPTVTGVSPTCSFTTPAAAAGTVAVTVNAFDGLSAKTPAGRFRYVRAPAPVITSLAPARGSSAGSTPLTVLGTNLAGGTVYVGGQPARLPDTSAGPCTLTACSVYAPAGKVGTARG